MKKFDLDAALAQLPHMRNFKVKELRGDLMFSAQFPTGTAVWALEVAFTHFGQWGWRTGARHLPRNNWELVSPEDTRCRTFAERVCEALDAAAMNAEEVAVAARRELAGRPF